MDVVLDRLEEQQITDYVMLMLGAPVVKIELDSSQVKSSISEACRRLNAQISLSRLQESRFEALRPQFLVFVQEMALALSKSMLGRIRSKYKPVKGDALKPMDGDTLLMESAITIQEWKTEVAELLGLGG